MEVSYGVIAMTCIGLINAGFALYLNDPDRSSMFYVKSDIWLAGALILNILD